MTIFELSMHNLYYRCSIIHFEHEKHLFTLYQITQYTENIEPTYAILTKKNFHRKAQLMQMSLLAHRKEHKISVI